MNTPEQLPWSLPKKILFRFAFLYFLLFIAFVNNGCFPFWNYITQYSDIVLHKAIPWIGKHILHLSYDITTFTNGSGDTTYDYVLLGCIALTAVIGTLVWSAADRKNNSYPRLYYWLITGIRYYLALTLISYGLVKVFKLQFPAPGLFRLTETYGESSPMGLAWTFLGFSKGYNVFMGIAELSGILLLFRRTMTIGAIIALMTTANVMAINYFYDVPVKIVSTSLVVMCVTLLLNDFSTLLKFFFTSEPVTLHIIPAPEVNNQWIRRGKTAFKWLLIVLVLGYGTYDMAETDALYGDNAPKNKLYGIYTLDKIVQHTDSLAVLQTDSLHWKQLIVEAVDYARIRFVNDSSSRFWITTDTVLKTLELKQRNDTTEKYTFNYRLPANNKLILSGRYKKDSVSIEFSKTKVDVHQFPLMNRGFHWINEYPNNK